MIMPFENSGPDARQHDLAAEVTREVTNHILKGADGPVISGMAAEAYQAKPIDPRVIGREHGRAFRANRQAYAGRTGGSGLQPSYVRPQVAVQSGDGSSTCRMVRLTLPTLAQVIYESTWQKTVDLEAWHAVHDHPDNLDKRDLILIVLSTPLWSPTKANYLEKLSLVDRALALDRNYLRGFERRARAYSSNSFCWATPRTSVAASVTVSRSRRAAAKRS